MHSKFHFQLLGDNWVLRLYKNDITLGEVVMTWPRSGYSREKALNRADRCVGETVRRSDEGTKFTYTQEIA